MTKRHRYQNQRCRVVSCRTFEGKFPAALLPDLPLKIPHSVVGYVFDTANGTLHKTTFAKRMLEDPLVPRSVIDRVQDALETKIGMTTNMEYDENDEDTR